MQNTIEQTEGAGAVSSTRLLGRARHDQLSNDLFWDIWSRDEDELLRWSGYNDGYWWQKVAPTDQFQIRVGKKTGKRYRLNPETNEVHEVP